jgi:hypothetical protein
MGEFSWIKDLADDANVRQEGRRESDRQEKIQQKQVALATGGFVDRLHQFFNTCSMEFNKHIKYDHLKMRCSRVIKRTKGTANAEIPELSYPEESFSFTFARRDWTFGVRGLSGVVEFIEMPTSDSSLSVNIDEVGIPASRKLQAEWDQANEKVVWKYEGSRVNADQLLAICREYIKEFIERTNP